MVGEKVKPHNDLIDLLQSQLVSCRANMATSRYNPEYIKKALDGLAEAQETLKDLSHDINGHEVFKGPKDNRDVVDSVKKEVSE